MSKLNMYLQFAMMGTMLSIQDNDFHKDFHRNSFIKTYGKGGEPSKHGLSTKQRKLNRKKAKLSKQARKKNK